MRLKVFKILLGFFSLFIIFGCSIPTDFYIQNLTNESKHIIIRYQGNIKSRLENDSYGAFSFNYKNGVASPKDFKKNKNLPSLNKTIVNNYQIEIILPPSSTTRVEKTHNYGWKMWSIDNIKIDNKEIKIEDIENQSVKDKSDYIYKIE